MTKVHHWYHYIHFIEEKLRSDRPSYLVMFTWVNISPTQCDSSCTQHGRQGILRRDCVVATRWTILTVGLRDRQYARVFCARSAVRKVCLQLVLGWGSG